MQPKTNWSVIDKDGVRATGTSKYQERVQQITITGKGADEETARKVCKKMGMKFLEGTGTIFSFTFKAECDENTSCFFWAGGKAL